MFCLHHDNWYIFVEANIIQRIVILKPKDGLFFFQFQCDMNSREKCIPPKSIVGGNKDIIGRLMSMNSLTKKFRTCLNQKLIWKIVYGCNVILGSQYRTVSCFWGNISCPGFRNLKQKQDICVDPYIRDNFCSDTYPSSWEPWPTNIRWRNNETYTERHIL